MSMIDDFEKQMNNAGIKTSVDTFTNAELWDSASERFPRCPFPWDAFPPSIAESLKQVAHSCATSDVSMPGAAMAIMASVVGRTISVSSKMSWNEPAIVWVADIRSSGEGKTPAVRMLLGPVYEAQKETDKRYHAEMDQWENTPKKNRGTPPRRPAGRFATDLTLEGLHMDVQQGHGGLVCVFDEISSMISSQNQFKQKGSDREAWLSLWEGHDARITRASKSVTINGARISMFGGVQPAIFRMVFGGNKGIYCTDGTIFRFLFTYEKDSFFPLTGESWTDENRNIWESTLKNAIVWSENIISADEWQPHVLKLTDDAQNNLYDYRNKIFKYKRLLPTQIQGFIPKAISYILRIAGILHCMFQFVQGKQPLRILTVEEISRAISVVEFYLAHAVSALRIIDADFSPAEENAVTVTLRKTIAALRNDLDSGRLAVGHIFEKFNEQCDHALKIKSEKAMGALLREHNLIIAPGKHHANGRRGVCCFVWDEKAEQFVQILQTSRTQCPQDKDIENTGVVDVKDIADISAQEYDIEGIVL